MHDFLPHHGPMKCHQTDSCREFSNRASPCDSFSLIEPFFLHAARNFSLLYPSHPGHNGMI